MKKKPDRETILLLCAEFEKDLSQLERLIKENSKAIERIEQGARESLDFAALGYTLHKAIDVYRRALVEYMQKLRSILE